MAYLQQTS